MIEKTYVEIFLKRAFLYMIFLPFSTILVLSLSFSNYLLVFSWYFSQPISKLFFHNLNERSKSYHLHTYVDLKNDDFIYKKSPKWQIKTEKCVKLSFNSHLIICVFECLLRTQCNNVRFNRPLSSWRCEMSF